MATDCIDVCNTVIHKLSEVGYEFSDDDDHDEILDALKEVEFFRDHGGRLITLVTEWARTKGLKLVPIEEEQ